MTALGGNSQGSFYGVKFMPRKPKRPCSFPNCSELVDGRFCKEHERQENKRYEKYQRDPETAKRYGRAWRKIRNKFIREHPLCQQCLKDSRLKTAEEVHHILPLRRGGTHDASNLMALCKSCHSRISVLDGDRFGKK